MKNCGFIMRDRAIFISFYANNYSYLWKTIYRKTPIGPSIHSARPGDFASDPGRHAGYDSAGRGLPGSKNWPIRAAYHRHGPQSIPPFYHLWDEVYGFPRRTIRSDFLPDIGGQIGFSASNPAGNAAGFPV